jgi:hypothetical protein
MGVIHIADSHFCPHRGGVPPGTRERTDRPAGPHNARLAERKEADRRDLLTVPDEYHYVEQLASSFRANDIQK